MRSGLLLLATALLALSAHAADKKIGRKEIDLDKLEKAFLDEEEDSDWHEDSFEWKEKMREEKKKKETGGQAAVNYDDPEDVKKAMKDGRLNVMGGGGGGMGGMGGMMGGGGGGMVQMSFIRLRNEHVKNLVDAEKLFGRFQEMLRTGGILVKGTAMEEDHHVTGEKYFQIITTQEDSKNFEMMEFLLEQPEVYSTRTNERDFFPKGHGPDPREDPKNKKKKVVTPTKKKKKKKKKKSKKKKKKTAKAKKAKQADEL